MESVLRKWTYDRQAALILNYKNKNIKASGRFEKSVRSEVGKDRIKIFGAQYIGGTISGRKPNANQSPEAIKQWSKKMAPILAQWVSDKGIGSGSWLHGYFIARKIATKGWTIPNSHGNDGRLLLDTFNPESKKELSNLVGRAIIQDFKLATKEIFKQIQR